MKEWFTIAELEALALPDMPASHRALAYEADSWRSRGLARKRAGKGGGWEYSLTALPSAAQIRLTMMARAANGEADEKARQKKELWARYEGLSAAHKASCEARLKAVLDVLDLEAHGVNTTTATQIAAGRHAVSPATLYNWRADTQLHDRTDWLAALAPAFTATAKRSDCDPRAWDFLVSDYLRAEEPRFTSCYRRMELAAKKQGWSPIPSERSLRRRLDAEIPDAVQTMARKGQDTAKKLYPAQRRDRTTLRAMQAVNMDGHKLDVFVKVPWSDKPVRLYLIGIQDLYSGKMLSWRLAEAETWEAVQLAVGDMVETYGIPEEFVLDNGRAFASKKITGRSRTRFRFKIREDDPEGLITALGCNLHWTQPYSGQSKPIERTWKDITEEISRHPAMSGAYTGNKPDAKPENYGTRAIPLAAMHAHVAEQIALNNARTGRKAAVCAGRSFDETFNASLADPATIVTRASAAQRALWLLASEGVRAQKGSGEIHFQGNRYWNGALGAHSGQKVTLRFDPDNLHNPVKVYDLQGRLICDAECIDDTGFFDQDSARLHERNRSTHKKGVKMQETALKVHSAQALADILARGERAENPEPPKPAVTRLVTGRRTAVAVKPEMAPEENRTIDFEANFARAMKLIRGGLED